MNQDPVVIVSMARTPIGNLLGALSTKTAPELGGVALKACLERASCSPDYIDEVLMGCVLPAGIGQAPARQAAHAGGLPWSAGATTINKMCGSAMQAIILGHDGLLAGSRRAVLAGGMECMSLAPYLATKARAGYRIGHGQLLDHMFYDGLEDAYDRGKLMGCFADDTADRYGFTRENQDDFAKRSAERALAAIEEGKFSAEIAPVTVSSRKETITVSVDEGPDASRINKISTLKPAFRENGSVTAANSSSISDGAASVLLMRKSQAEKWKLPILAVIRAHATHSHEPAWFTTAPSFAIQSVVKKAGWSMSEVDLFEINEAFAVVAMTAMKDCDLPADKVNIHGGACVLGHPIGASGARIVVTLLSALQQYGLHRGVASLCIGGGEATALAIERM